MGTPSRLARSSAEGRRRILEAEVVEVARGDRLKGRGWGRHGVEGSEREVERARRQHLRLLPGREGGGKARHQRADRLQVPETPPALVGLKACFLGPVDFPVGGIMFFAVDAPGGGGERGDTGGATAAAAAVSADPVSICTTCLKEEVSAWTNVVG
ncbi:hypothetical protein HPP92_024049 [Vanilla planifolia]|uniref:Uncharacterized protein n=1 Tax=Vanilla planifolia TaxID=51239 RepID=A0A835PNH0_VANPL|nr:hypothetical protein HPP92_024049 [Vanilla planifolia]